MRSARSAIENYAVGVKNQSRMREIAGDRGRSREIESDMYRIVFDSGARRSHRLDVLTAWDRPGATR